MKTNRFLIYFASCFFCVLGFPILTYSENAPAGHSVIHESNPALSKISDVPTWQLYLVDIHKVIPNIHLDIRYFGDYNFVGRHIDGYNAPKCLLTRQAAEALKMAQNELIPQGYSLKIYDCYRPQQAVDLFVLWTKDSDDTKTKAIFYPRVDKSHLVSEGYIAEKSGHSRGSTLDLTIVPLGDKSQRTCKFGKLCKDDSIDMGTPFDFFDPLSITLNPTISGQQKRNRLFLKALMEKWGFKNLPQEWWHFTFNNEPYPETYFNFPIESYPRVGARCRDEMGMIENALIGFSD